MISYGLILFILSSGMFTLSNDSDKAIIGIHNIMLILVPLVVMIYTVSQIYNSTDFIRLLLTQPIKRRFIFFSQFLSITLVLLMVQLFAIGLSLILFSDGSLLPVVMLNIVFLTFIFSSLSALIAYKVDEKVRGIGITIFLGIFFLAIYDGLVLLLIQGMSDYPIEKYGIMLTLFNPIDMCRILFIFKMDISALMGLTGAIMQKFIGSALGTVLIYSVLSVWVILPLWLASRYFINKDY